MTASSPSGVPARAPYSPPARSCRPATTSGNKLGSPAARFTSEETSWMPPSSAGSRTSGSGSSEAPHAASVPAPPRAARARRP